MKPLSPRERLAQSLDAIGDYAQLAHKAGVTPRDFLNAQSGRICPTVPFLRICVAVQHDPMPELPYVMPEKPSDFDFGFLSMALRLKRGLNGHDETQAGAAAGLSPVTISRIERGDSLAIGIIVRACKYMNIHCFSYLNVTDTPSISKKINEAEAPSLRPSVSRETSAPIEPSPLDILLKRRAYTLRRVDMLGRALVRLEGKKDYADAFARHQRYLASVAALTLSIDHLRQAEGKEVRVLGRLAT
jgi:transcriptional regulator with XRE-family HTH domain